MSKLNHTSVLIVDDEEEMARLLAMILKRQADVLVAHDGQEGLNLALKEGPDVILTDLMMPGVDGFDLMRKVMSKIPYVPVIVITAYGSMTSAVKALRLGAFDFLVKPLDPQAVRDTVARAARQHLEQKQKIWRTLINNALSTTRDPAHIVKKLLALMASIFDAEYGMVIWPEETAATVFLHPTDRMVKQPFLQWGEAIGLTGENAKRPTAELAAEITIDGNPPFTGSLLGWPLLTHNTPHCSFIFGRKQPNFFDQDDVAFLESITPFAGLALDNAKTYTSLKTSNDRLSTLQNINALTFNAKLSLNRILRLAVEGIRQNLGYSAIMICLPENHTHQLVIRAASGKFDKFLRRRGDTPGRRIVFPLDHADNPFTKTLCQKNIQDYSVQAWMAALTEALAPDMAQALAHNHSMRCIGLPLWQGEDVVGVLVIGLRHNFPLAPDERMLLTSLANQIALVVTNATLYQAEQRRRREMEALYQSGLVITSSLSHAEVLKAITQQIVELTNVESCIISRWNALKDVEVIELFLEKAGNNWIEKTDPGTEYNLSERPLVRQVLKNQQLRLIRHDDPRLFADERAQMEEYNIKLRLIMPLIVREQSIGVIELRTSEPDTIFTDQIIRIAQGLAAQASIALENARLHEAEVRRIEHEMDLAQRIQLSLLPQDTPQIPGLSIAARSVSARLVGGDFYRYMSMPDGRFGVVIGDVSGKGVPSALFMAITITALDTQVRNHLSPGTLLNNLNHALYPRMQTNRMNTGLLVVLFNPDDRTLEIANAGMIAPLIRQADEAAWLDVRGFPVGATPDTQYHSQIIRLQTATIIIMTSDGLLEAQNTRGDLFGFERFQNAALSLPETATSQDILDHIWQETIEHTKGMEPHDDMTLIIIKASP